jgi:hypothetical protein
MDAIVVCEYNPADASTKGDIPIPSQPPSYSVTHHSCHHHILTSTTLIHTLIHTLIRRQREGGITIQSRMTAENTSIHTCTYKYSMEHSNLPPLTQRLLAVVIVVYRYQALMQMMLATRLSTIHLMSLKCTRETTSLCLLLEEYK